jgi:hypothetical protein
MWKRHAVLLSGEGIPYDGLAPRAMDQHNEAMTAAEELLVVVGSSALGHGKARGRDAVRLHA